MTVPDTSRRAGPFGGNGVTTAFPFTFKLFSDEDMTVVVTDANGVESTLVLDSDFSVTINADQDASPGGTITYPISGTPLAVNRTLTAVGAEPYTQELDLPSGGAFSPRALENALDRIVFQIQQLGERLGRSMTLPVSAAAADTQLPVPAANAIIGWNAAGSALVNYEALPVGSANGANVSFTPAGANAVATTAQAKMREQVSAFDFMTTAQIADCQAYGFVMDLTTPLQNALNAAYLLHRSVYLPAGGYRITAALQVPGTNNNAGKVHKVRIFGDGFGEAGAVAFQNSGTLIKSVTNAPIFNYTATVLGNGNGEVEIDHLALWGTSATPVINLDTFYGLSSIHHCNIVQSGTGNGVQINWGATYDVHHCYIVGASYTLINLGAARTGTGIYIAQDTNSGGLQTIRQCTVAGWHTSAQIGITGGSAYTYSPIVDKCEFSYCYIGLRLTGQCEGATVSQCYFEGQDAGYSVLDEGNYNRVRDCFFFFSAGSLSPYVMLSSTTAGKFGSRYEGNTFYLFNIPSTGLDVTSNGVDGGPAKVVSRNHFIQQAAAAGVTGLKINGVDPRIEAVSNDFQPSGTWTGAGTYKINNTSTSSDGTTGNAIFGLAQGQSLSGARTVPLLGRGAHNIAVDPTVLTNTSISAGVMTVGELSAFTLTPTGNVSITSFAAPNLPDKTFSIHVTATAFAVTFTHGSLLKLSGSANLVTGANGCWINFQIKPGGVAWETNRVVY